LRGGKRKCNRFFAEKRRRGKRTASPETLPILAKTTGGSGESAHTLEGGKKPHNGWAGDRWVHAIHRAEGIRREIKKGRCRHRKKPQKGTKWSVLIEKEDLLLIQKKGEDSCNQHLNR